MSAMQTAMSQETPWGLISRHVLRYLDCHRLSVADFSRTVADRLRADGASYDPDFALHGDRRTCEEANRKKLGRWLNRDETSEPSLNAAVKLVQTLPDAERACCLRDLFGVFGALYVPLVGEGVVDLHLMGDLLRDFGEFVQRAGVLLADDNAITADDSEADLMAGLSKCLAVQGQLQAYQLRIQAALDDRGARQARKGLRAVRS